MNWDRYRKAMDALSFAPDFQARTEALLRQRWQEPTKKEDLTMNRRTMGRFALVAAAAALLTMTAFAAVGWLTPAQVAGELGTPLLAQAFESAEAEIINESVETGDYRITLAGLVNGSGLTGWYEDVNQVRTYAVVAIERLDSTPLESTLDNDWIPTPLVSGYTPWAVNLWTLDSGTRSFAQEGVLYYLVDTQSLEMFADHTVYLAVYQGSSPDRDTFRMDETGAIEFQDDFTAPHALFTLPLDAGKADPAAARAFVENTGINYVYDPDPEETPLTVRRSDDGTLMEILPGDGLWFTPESYEAYLAEEKVRLARQVEDGVLSQELCDKTLAEMEETLSGLRDGTVWAVDMGERGVATVVTGESGLPVTWNVTEEGLEAVVG